MTIFSSNSSLFPATNKKIQFGNKSINVVNGANTLASVQLCNVTAKYENYQKLSILVPAGAVNFVLSFPTLGIKPTFLTLIAKYCNCNSAKEFLYWNFIHSNDAPNTMTNIMVLTGTSTNPIPQIVISNPDPNKSVTLDVLVSSVENDYLDDISNYIYIGNLAYTSIFSYDTDVLGINTSDGNLFLTVDLVNVNNVIKVPYKNRLILDDTTQNDIVIDFVSESDTYQVLSSLNYWLNNPGTVLPIFPLDTDGPVITYLPSVIIDSTDPLNIIREYTFNFSTEYTKSNFILDVIDSCIDVRDGNISINPINIKFNNTGNNIDQINTILQAGTYQATIEVSDIANNKTKEIITIYAI